MIALVGLGFVLVAVWAIMWLTFHVVPGLMLPMLLVGAALVLCGALLAGMRAPRGHP